MSKLLIHELHPCFFFVYSVVRHLDICINNEGVKDKLRIQVTEHGTKKIVGKEFYLLVAELNGNTNIEKGYTLKWYFSLIMILLFGCCR